MNEKLLTKIIKSINEASHVEMKIMEVCGTHTHAIAKHGVDTLIDPKIQLLSGPGCPVCVTPENIIDAAIQILDHDNTILCTFGDLVRVKGANESILDQRKKGRSLSILYSPFEALEIAHKNKDKLIIFLAVGFETTAPVIASVIKLTKDSHITNLFFLTSLKLMPPVLSFILEHDHKQIEGIICPGHVAAVMGEKYFQFIEERYHIPAVIAGFDPLDILSALHWFTQVYNKDQSRKFVNLYKKMVKYHGNEKAINMIHSVFHIADGNWRGIGSISNSSLIIKEDYSQFDALNRFNIVLSSKQNHEICMCKEILLGNKTPMECIMFAITCTPATPMGPCMISNEGTCAAFYRYKRRIKV